MAEIADLVALIEPEAEALGFDLVRVMLFGSDDERTLQIMAERPDTRQLNIDDCAELSRRISERLDALEEAGEDPIDGAYRLEVSSPGIDRPLTRAKDFEQWAGHEAKISMVKGYDGQRTLRGPLGGIDGDLVAITDRKAGAVSVPFGQIHAAQLVLTDELIAATRPIDTTGVEDIVETDDEEKADD